MPNETMLLEATPPRSWIERVWSTIADRGRAFVSVPASLPPAERAKLLAVALLSGRGEASGAALARDLLAVLRGLDQAGRQAFYAYLAEGFTPDEARLRAVAQAYLDAPTPELAAALADAAEPPRQELLRRMNHAQGGTLALVRMREELLPLVRGQPALKPLDDDLRHLFASWFNRGFLELRRIDWNTPAAVLEKLIRHEAVHEIQGWPDLRRRLAADRRCFGFFHPALPGEPLIFVEVALTRGLADAVQPLLAPDDDEAGQRARALQADTAIFYSISNCQDGLRGVSFGNFLIKQVVEELKGELPQLRRFSTLSPVPGLRRHVERVQPAGLPDELDPATADTDTRQLLLRETARFLTDTRDGRGPADPVARFHLGNGARLERINWAGNLAARGIAESYGVMVNYLYDPETIETNHEAFARGGAVARSEAVGALLEGTKARRRG